MRRNIQRPFDELEIWYMLYTGVVAMTQFEKLGLKMGNISPVNVLMNRKGHIRYVNRYSWLGEYPKMPGKLPLCYIAPE
jgi:hypothetical protein